MDTTTQLARFELVAHLEQVSFFNYHASINFIGDSPDNIETRSDGQVSHGGVLGDFYPHPRTMDYD